MAAHATTLLGRPRQVRSMPYWPGPKALLAACEYGAKKDERVALGLACPDGSVVVFEYWLAAFADAPASIYEKIGAPPYFLALVLDRGTGIKLRHGIPTMITPNDAEKYVAEVHKHLGKERRLFVLASTMNEFDTRRRYFWGDL